MTVQVVGKITKVEIIAAGKSIRDLRRVRKLQGKGRWRKLKGIATVRLPDESLKLAEVHWYEAHGIGRRELKIKKLLDY